MRPELGTPLAILALIGALASPVAAQTGEPPTTRQQWTTAVREAFAARKPKAEEIRGVTGDLRPELSITIRPDGSLSDVAVKRASGFQSADDAAVRMVRSAGPLPAFSPDMPKEDLKLVLPVRFSLAPEAEEDQRLFVDTSRSLRLEVQKPLFVTLVPNDPAYDVLLLVIAGKEPPAYAPAGEPVCMVGFKAAAADQPKGQAELNAPDQVEPARERMVRQSSEKGLEVERSDVTDYRSGRLIELQLKPKPGAEQAAERFYQSSIDYPAGNVAMLCRTDETTMATALDAYRSIRDGFSVAPN